MNAKQHVFLASLGLIALVVSACGATESGASSAVLTEAALIYAESLTQTAQAAPPTATATPVTPSPTVTPLPPTFTPTITGTPPTATASPTAQPQTGGNSGGGGGAGCYRAELTYETIPDGTKIEATGTFKKRWVLKNKGTCTWTPGFTLRFIQGDLMGAKATIPLTDFIEVEIPPEEHLDIEVSFVAPAEDGTYTGYWMLQSDNGTLFGLGPDGRAWFWVEIQSKGDADGIESGDPTATPTP